MLMQYNPISCNRCIHSGHDVEILDETAVSFAYVGVHTMKRFLLLLVIGFVACCTAADHSTQAENDIRSAIHAQVAAWNAGDLDGFMEYYWNSPDLVFQSGSVRSLGWQTLYDKYDAKYFPEGHGTLTFSEIEVRVISETTAYATGRWRVEDVENAGDGLFTLILRRLENGWRIVHDHTS